MTLQSSFFAIKTHKVLYMNIETHLSNYTINFDCNFRTFFAKNHFQIHDTKRKSRSLKII